jgi:hypothetical protein
LKRCLQVNESARFLHAAGASYAIGHSIET